MSSATDLNALQSQAPAFQVWLQEFAWTRQGIARRQHAMQKHSPGMQARLCNMPVFCMETALKLLLWSDVVYECVVEPEGELGAPMQVFAISAVTCPLKEYPLRESVPLSDGSVRQPKGHSP